MDKGPRTTQGRLSVLAAAVLWSTGGVISKSLDLDSLTIAFYRGLFAGLALLPFVPRQRWIFRPVLLPLGVVFGAMVAFFLGAVKTTTSANAIFLQCTATFWVVPLSAIFLGERPDRRARASIALAMVGIVAIVGWGYDGRPNEWQGIILGLASGITYACVAVSLRGLRHLDPIWLSAALNLLGSAALGLWAWAIGQGLRTPSTTQILVLIGFGVFQMAIPYTLFARGLREIGAPEAGLIGLVEPILNPIWVVLIVHEWPAGPTIIGGLFLLGGLVYRYWPSFMTSERRVATTK
jgi:DME family drug/metabolite transporter